MPNVSFADSKELLRLRREILTTMRIQMPNFQRSEALNKLISDTLSASFRAGLKEREAMHMTLINARKFIMQLSSKPLRTEIEAS